MADTRSNKPGNLNISSTMATQGRPLYGHRINKCNRMHVVQFVPVDPYIKAKERKHARTRPLASVRINLRVMHACRRRKTETSGWLDPPPPAANAHAQGDKQINIGRSSYTVSTYVLVRSADALSCFAGLNLGRSLAFTFPASIPFDSIQRILSA